MGSPSNHVADEPVAKGANYYLAAPHTFCQYPCFKVGYLYNLTFLNKCMLDLKSVSVCKTQQILLGSGYYLLTKRLRMLANHLINQPKCYFDCSVSELTRIEKAMTKTTRVVVSKFKAHGLYMARMASMISRDHGNWRCRPGNDDERLT